MKKNIIVVLMLFTLTSFGQIKKVVAKQPTFKITFDKFENKYTYDGVIGNIGIYANGPTDDFTDIESKYLTITVYDSYLTYSSGIILLFSDGTKMNIETEEVLGKDAGKGLWKYLVFANPSEEEWLELSNKIIVSYKFHIFERDYKNGNQFKALVNNFYE